jgi:hypothetical protein|eukprot:COSAG01_NODE_3441_length_6094_cov_16.295079_4_plen_74_part_00
MPNTVCANSFRVPRFHALRRAPCAIATQDGAAGNCQTDFWNASYYVRYAAPKTAQTADARPCGPTREIYALTR